MPFPDESFDAAFSTFTHTDFDDFAGAVAEARRVLKRRGQFVYVGNHPASSAPRRSTPSQGFRACIPGTGGQDGGSRPDAPGTTPGGWRARLGSFVHLPLAQFLSCFAGFTLEAAEELANGYEYPKTVALAFTKQPDG